MNYTDVLAAFTALTCIEFRIRGYDLRQQAEKFAEHFTIEELEIVVHWTRWQIKKGEGGFNDASLQWKTLMGSRDGEGQFDFLPFQNRLGLAREAMKRRAWFPPRKREERPANVVSMPPQEDPESIARRLLGQ